MYSGPMSDERPAAGDPELGSLLHSAFRQLRRSWVDQLAPWEVTPFQWRALHMLIRTGGKMRPGDLASRLRIAPRSATEVIDQLESRDLVERSPDPTDRRAVTVSETEAGRELHEAIVAKRRELSAEHFSTLTPDEQSELARLLKKLGRYSSESSESESSESESSESESSGSDGTKLSDQISSSSLS